MSTTREDPKKNQWLVNVAFNGVIILAAVVGIAFGVVMVVGIPAIAGMIAVVFWYLGFGAVGLALAVFFLVWVFFKFEGEHDWRLVGIPIALVYVALILSVAYCESKSQIDPNDCRTPARVGSC